MGSQTQVRFSMMTVILAYICMALSSCAQSPSASGPVAKPTPRASQKTPDTTASRPDPRAAVRDRRQIAVANANSNTVSTGTGLRNTRRAALEERLGSTKFGMSTREVPSDSKEKGSLVTSVKPYSVAEIAGISVGDIVVELDSVAITSDAQFKQIVTGLTDETRHTLMFVRDTARLKTSLNLTDTSTVFNAAAPGKRGLWDINTLKYALIDSKTRAVTFIGTYDPAYATGPIHYAEILRDVLSNPYPSFSLEPSAQQRSDYDRVDAMISADIARMGSSPDYCNQWAQKLLDLLLSDQSLTIDNKRFFKNCGSALNMTGDDLKRLYDAASGKIQIPQDEVFSLATKLMRGVGLPDVGNAMLAFVGGGTPDDIIQKMCEALNLKPQYQRWVDQMIAGNMTYDQFKDETIMLCMATICRQFEAPESEIQKRIALVRSGAQTNDLMIDYFSEQMGNFITNKAGSRMINGLVLSPELMSKLYNMPVPRSDLVFTNVPAYSHLGDALFRADYVLKTLCSNPDIQDQCAGHLTSQAFLQKEATARKFYLPAGAEVGVGNRLIPAEVAMRTSPNGDVVQFQSSQVKVLSWVRDLGGNAKNGEAATFINAAVPKYGPFLTAHYDEYTHAFPELHKMSEVAKCVALARWAKVKGYTLRIENASDEKIPLPRQVPGFWTAVFHADSDKASLTVIEEGGASFSEDEGEAWVKAQPDDAVASDISRQLMASTVLAEQAAMSAEAGDLEAARELADKSARAMSGDIDLNMLPALSDVPMPGEPAIYATANAELINQASACLDSMKTAQSDLQRAQGMQTASPQQADTLRQQATQTQDTAQAKLKDLLSYTSILKAHPSYANQVVVSLKSGTPMVMPTGTAASVTQVASQDATALSKPLGKEDWPTQAARLKAELAEIDTKIASTRTALLRLNGAIQADMQQYADWEKVAGEGFDSCVKMAGDVVVEWAAGGLFDRYDEMHKLAQTLPNQPTDLIEKYRYLASLMKRMQEAKLAKDYGDLAAKENMTEAEMYETIRDGIGQLSGLFQLDKTIPGAAWKYGSLTVDLAYNFTQLALGWKNVTGLEGNQALQREAVQKLAEQMRLLVESKKDRLAKIEAGEPLE